jgi:hypothetical protein
MTYTSQQATVTRRFSAVQVDHTLLLQYCWVCVRCIAARGTALHSLSNLCIDVANVADVKYYVCMHTTAYTNYTVTGHRLVNEATELRLLS